MSPFWEKASWISGIFGTILTAVGLIATFTDTNKSSAAKEAEAAKVKTLLTTPPPPPAVNVTGSNNTTIQGSGNTIINVAPGDHTTAGYDGFVITEKIANLPVDGLEKAFNDDMNDTNVFCGESEIVIRNLSKSSIVLNFCVPHTDNCGTLAGIAPGERRVFATKEWREGSFDLYDDQKRFLIPVRILKTCPL